MSGFTDVLVALAVVALIVVRQIRPQPAGSRRWWLVPAVLVLLVLREPGTVDGRHQVASVLLLTVELVTGLLMGAAWAWTSRMWTEPDGSVWVRGTKATLAVRGRGHPPAARARGSGRTHRGASGHRCAAARPCGFADRGRTDQPGDRPPTACLHGDGERPTSTTSSPSPASRTAPRRCGTPIRTGWHSLRGALSPDGVSREGGFRTFSSSSTAAGPGSGECVSVPCDPSPGHREGGKLGPQLRGAARTLAIAQSGPRAGEVTRHPEADVRPACRRPTVSGARRGGSAPERGHVRPQRGAVPADVQEPWPGEPFTLSRSL
jgi:hypothetical protein